MTSHREAGPRIVVLSGPVGAGKSTLARGLAERYEARHIRTQDLMRDHAEATGESLPAERHALQDYGERLDAETAGSGSPTASPRSSPSTTTTHCS